MVANVSLDAMLRIHIIVMDQVINVVVQEVDIGRQMSTELVVDLLPEENGISDLKVALKENLLDTNLQTIAQIKMQFANVLGLQGDEASDGLL